MVLVVDPTVPKVKMYCVQFVSWWKFLVLLTKKQRGKKQMVKNLVTLRNKLAHSNQPLTSKANIAFIKLFCRFPLFACIWQRAKSSHTLCKLLLLCVNQLRLTAATCVELIIY